ncbi:MAG: hypothetical protein WBA10_02755 [Elainellaceae cyanobacterium]
MTHGPESMDLNALVTQTCVRLRQKGFQIGVGEYMAALKAVEGGFGETLEALAETLKLLWCHSQSERSQFDPVWQAVQQQIAPTPIEEDPATEEVDYSDRQDTPLDKPQNSPGATSRRQETVAEPPQPKAELGALPVQAPFVAMDEEDTSVLQTYYPITRRSMVYNWRYLRRPVANGPRDVLDIKATLGLVTQQGFYLYPVYRRRQQNSARLLLLLDQNGSMTPFHRFTRELVETACYDSSLQPENLSVAYFQNVPGKSLYNDIYLTQPVAIDTALAFCDSQTSVLIVSDAGAARGYRKLERIRTTTRFLLRLKRYTSLIAWLNPMPRQRWIGSSAEIIFHSVPMYQMDREGLSNAIDVIRGQPLARRSSLL